MVIYEGKINYKALKKSKMDINDLISKSRDKGYFDLSDIEYAVFENSGGLSIMQKSPNAKLPYYLIDDGYVNHAALRTLGKDKNWLYKKLAIAEKKDLKNIILAIYSKDTDNIEVSRK